MLYASLINMKEKNVIYGINGPVVTVKDTKSFSMMEMVYVGESHLIGEVIGINDDITTIQVYEETTGLKPGEIVEGTGGPMKVCLGPGLLDNIFYAGFLVICPGSITNRLNGFGEIDMSGFHCDHISVKAR